MSWTIYYINAFVVFLDVQRDNALLLFLSCFCSSQTTGPNLALFWRWCNRLDWTDLMFCSTSRCSTFYRQKYQQMCPFFLLKNPIKWALVPERLQITQQRQSQMADVKSMRVKSLGPQRKWSITKQAGGKNAEQRDKVSCDLSVLCPHRNKHKKQMHSCLWEMTLGYR